MDVSRSIPAALPIKGSQDDTGSLVARFTAARSLVIEALRKCPALLDLVRRNGKPVYSVELPKEAFAALSKGSMSWNPRPDGTLPAVLRNVDSKEIAHHVSLRQANLEPGVLQALNNLAVQTALCEIIGRLEELDEKVDLLLRQGRANRHGKVRGGFRLYEQALEMAPGAARTMALSNAAQSLEGGRSSLMENIEADLKDLRPPSPFKAFRSAMTPGQTATEKLTARYALLCDDLAMVLLATRWLVLIHEELEQPGAARKVVHQLAASASEWAPLGRALSAAVPYSQDFDPEQVWRLAEQSLPPVLDGRLGPAMAVVLQVTSAELLDE